MIWKFKIKCIKCLYFKYKYKIIKKGSSWYEVQRRFLFFWWMDQSYDSELGLGLIKKIWKTREEAQQNHNWYIWGTMFPEICNLKCRYQINEVNLNNMRLPKNFKIEQIEYLNLIIEKDKTSIFNCENCLKWKFPILDNKNAKSIIKYWLKNYPNGIECLKTFRYYKTKKEI